MAFVSQVGAGLDHEPGSLPVSLGDHRSIEVSELRQVVTHTARRAPGSPQAPQFTDAAKEKLY
jgi:hypothetical protein